MDGKGGILRRSFYQISGTDHKEGGHSLLFEEALANGKQDVLSIYRTKSCSTGKKTRLVRLNSYSDNYSTIDHLLKNYGKPTPSNSG